MRRVPVVCLGGRMDHETADIGARLRRAREQRGLSLRDIASVTKISMMALKAIEQNEFGRLPGGLFRKAYVRAFAAAVGLDGDEVAREYRSRFEPEPVADMRPTHRRGWKGANDRRVAAGAWAGIALLAAALLVSRQAQRPQALPDQERILNERGAGPPDTTTPVADSDSVEGGSFAMAAAETGDPTFRLEMRFTDWCWVSAVSDGERVLYRLMRPGERTLIEARREITVRVGDAGAVTYAVNGTPGQPLGRSGEVVTVRISGDSLDRGFS